MANGKFVSYLRVSTQRQGRSGLGLEAQREAVREYLDSKKGKPIAEFVEVESGKNDDRPKLKAALHRAKVTGATLIVAKLDRLSRDMAFLAHLQKGGVKLAFCDIPDANELTIGMFALIAQHERKLISDRTKNALAAAKKRGVKLGNPNGADAFGDISNDAAVARIKAKAHEFAEDILPIIADIRAQGVTTLEGIADELNARDIETARGGKWYPASVRNVLMRTAEAA
jgi:DNA invertase Pin-like site-specific DNA recombinase